VLKVVAFSVTLSIYDAINCIVSQPLYYLSVSGLIRYMTTIFFRVLIIVNSN